MKLVPGFIILGLGASFLMSYVLDHALIYASEYMKMSGISAGSCAGSSIGSVSSHGDSGRGHVPKEILDALDFGQRLLAPVAACHGAILASWK